MDESRQDRIKELFDLALRWPRDQRTEYLDYKCGGDAELLAEVQAMLVAHIGKPSRLAATPDATRIRPPSDNRIGQQIGPHTIIEKIGVGGMGVIYKAHDTRLDRHVALKFIPKYLNADAEVRERFITEARAASRLDNPHICVIHDIEEAPDGMLFITMPFYDGETLDMRITRGALPLTEAVNIAIQVSDGLAAAHRQHIVHRDIKPANIMLTDNGVKILDFGVAKLDNIKLTQTGSSIGTLAYMSPEQLRGETVDGRADIWALGATLFEMISGRRAFPDESLPQVVHTVAYGNEDPVQTLAADLPMQLTELLQRSLARDLALRLPHMEAMLQELMNLHDALTNSHPPTIHNNNSPQRTRFAWDDKLLAELANILLPHVGPLATMLVNTCAKQAADVQELGQLLAEKIPNPKEREQFLRKVKLKLAAHTHPPIPKTVHTDGTVNGINLSPTQLARLEAGLTPYIGPITGTLIRHIASQVSQFEDLCRQLAEQIPNAHERQRFLQEVKDEENI